MGQENRHEAPFSNRRPTPIGFFLLMPLVVVCYGAVVVSIGRPWHLGQTTGRAMAASVSCYRHECRIDTHIPLFGATAYIALGSSLLAVAFLTDNCLSGGSGPEFFVPALMLWCAVNCVLAIALAVLAYRSFDRRMGRMPLDLASSAPSQRERKRFRRRELARLAAPVETS